MFTHFLRTFYTLLTQKFLAYLLADPKYEPQGDMKVNIATVIPAPSAPTDRSASDEPLFRQRRMWRIGILLSGGLGILLSFVGILLSFETYTGLTGRSVSSVGTLLLAASFPLLFLAAHCMDKVRDLDKCIRLEYCRRHGFEE